VSGISLVGMADRNVRPRTGEGGEGAVHSAGGGGSGGAGGADGAGGAGGAGGAFGYRVPAQPNVSLSANGHPQMGVGNTLGLVSRMEVVEPNNRSFQNLPDTRRGQTQRIYVPDHKFKMVTFYSHKGGVAKTTNLYTTAFTLASAGERVLVVDADHQRNLTQFALSWSATHPPEGVVVNPRGSIANFSQQMGNEDTVLTAVEQVFYPPQDTPGTVRVPKLWRWRSMHNLYLLAGDERIHKLDELLAANAAQSSGEGAVQTAARKTFGAFYHAIKLIAFDHEIDTVLVDLSPSAGFFNRTVLLSSHYFCVPAQPDHFSQEAIKSITRYMPIWVGATHPMPGWGEAGGDVDGYTYRRIVQWSRSSMYPLPAVDANGHMMVRVDPGTDRLAVLPRLPKFLGLILSRVGYTGGMHPASYNIREFIGLVQDATADMIAILEQAPVPQGGCDLRAISMQTFVPGYYDIICDYALPADDGMRVDVKKGTITFVREFHQLSFLSQRLSMPVPGLNTGSELFLRFKAPEFQQAMEEYYESLADGHAAHSLVEPQHEDYFGTYSSADKQRLRDGIVRAFRSFERVARCIMDAPAFG